MPSTCALSNCTGMPNAMALMIVTLCAASTPSMSNVGSASAYPNACACFSATSKSSPLARISDRMKLVVPLMMPAIHSMRFAVSPSRSALMIGIPPATAASKATTTPLSRAAAKISVPCTRQQRLVGGDHMLAGANRLQHQGAGDAVAADQLDHDVDLGVGDHRPRVAHHARRIAHNGSALAQCPGRPPWRCESRVLRGAGFPAGCVAAR